MTSRKEIRKKTLCVRLKLTKEEVAAKSAVILKRLLALKEYQNAKIVMVYNDFRNEVRTEELIGRSMALGKKVAVPFTDLQAKRLLPSLLDNFPADLAPGAWGILEPAPGRLRPLDPKKIDLVIVPGVAFDEMGNRLGYGGGFYDRFLPRTRADTFCVGIAFELQIWPEIKPGPFDRPVDCLVTEKRVIYTKPGQPRT